MNKAKRKRKLNGIFSSLSFLTNAAGNEKYLSLSKNVVSFPSSLVSLSPWTSTTFQGIFLQNTVLLENCLLNLRVWKGKWGFFL